MKYFTVFFSAIIFIFTGHYYMFGQEQSTIEQEEAPAAVWDMKIGDKEVDLYLNGNWKIGIKGGLSVESGPEGVVFPAAFPGLTSFEFYQEPDLTLELWLMNRFYLETSFLEGFDKNTYAVGYRGTEGENLQSVRIGNSDINIEQYSGLNVPAPKFNTPGISAAFQTDLSSHDVLIRYDPTSEHKKIFLGEYEITEEIIQIGDFIRGQHFILPENNLDFVEVYIADSRGIYTGSDGRSYKTATDNEVYFSLSDGTVSLFESNDKDVLIYYEKSGISVGETLVPDFVPPLVNGEPDPGGTATDFSWGSTNTWYWYPTPTVPVQKSFEQNSSVTVNGRKTLKVFTSDKFSPFEILSNYSISSQLPPDLWRTEIFLSDNSFKEAEDSDNYTYQLNINDQIISLFNQASTDIRSPWSRFPLADSYSQIYGSKETDNKISGRSILLTLKNSSGLTLGPGVVPGSEQIFINGYETGTVQVDYSTGALSFNRYIYPQDRIVVLYRTETTDLSGGDLLFAQGNRFYPSEFMELYLAEMFRWNVSKKSSTTTDSTSPGGLTIAGGLQYEKENLSLQLTSNLGLYTPDTTGYLRIEGMENSGYNFSIGKNLLKQSTLETWDGTTFLSSADRDPLIYSDFHSTDGLGQYFMNTYNWPDYTVDTGKEGPSAASRVTDDNFDSNVMVLDYDINASRWSAGDLLLAEDGPLDLSRFTSMSLNFQKQNTSGDISVILLIGENGEFDDWDTDGYPDQTDESLIVDIDASTSVLSAENIWTEFKYYFTQSEMDRLVKSRSLRVLIKEKSGTVGAAGRLLISNLHFNGSTFDSQVIDEDSTSDKEIVYASHPLDILELSETDDLTAQALTSSYNETDELFHSSGESQKALRVRWDLSDSLPGDGEYWIIETHTPPVSPDSYRTFSFYINNDAASLSGSYEVSLTDSRDRGYSFTYSPSDTGWEKLSLSLETGIVDNSSGSLISSAEPDLTMGELTRFKITGTGTSEGLLYLDEMHYSDPSFSLNGNVELLTEFTYPGTIIETPKGFPLLSDFAVSNQFHYSGGTVLSSQSESSHSIEDTLSVSLDMLLFDITGHIKINWTPDYTDLSGGHSLIFPSGFNYAGISDVYSRTGKDDTASVIRENIIHFTIPDLGTIRFSTEADGKEASLIQNWKAETGWMPSNQITLEGSLVFEQFSLWDKNDEGNYFSNWVNDYNLVIPASDSVSIRSVKGSLNLNLSTKPIGFLLTPHLSFETEDSPVQQQTDEGGFTMRIPIGIMDNSGSTWLLTPSYSREFREQREASLTDSFSDGFNNMFHDLGLWMPLTSFIPFYELFATESIDVFQDKTNSFNSAVYSPDFGLSLTREFGSRIFDIFIPYSFDAHFIRNFGKKNDTYFNDNRFEFSFRQTAVNLFGDFGTYSRFMFYGTDEFTSSLQFNLYAEDGKSPVPAECIYQNYLAFYGKNKNSLILENRIENDFMSSLFSDLLSLKFIWERPMKDRFNLEFLNNLIKKQHYWSHEESLQLTINHPWETADSSEIESFNISLKHLSKMNVPGLGALKSWLALGFYSDPEIFRAGFEAGLELEVSF